LTRSQSLKARLAADTTIAGLVADRIYPEVALPPAGQVTLTYEFDTRFDYDLSGVVGVSTVDLHAWARDYDVAQSLSDAIYASLQGFKGILGGAGGIEIIDLHVERQQDKKIALTPETIMFDAYSSYSMTYQMG
jgi:Protein of unknown function (DUF3168)